MPIMGGLIRAIRDKANRFLTLDAIASGTLIRKMLNHDYSSRIDGPHSCTELDQTQKRHKANRLYFATLD